MLFLSVRLEQSPVENAAKVSCKFTKRGRQRVGVSASIYQRSLRLVRAFSRGGTMRNPQSCPRREQRNNAPRRFLFSETVGEEVFPDSTCMQCARRVNSITVRLLWSFFFLEKQILYMIRIKKTKKQKQNENANQTQATFLCDLKSALR